MRSPTRPPSAVATGADAADLVQRGRGLHRRARRRPRPGLRADPRRHRRHVRARPAPVPAAHRRQPAAFGTPGRPPPASRRSDPASRRGANGRRRAMEVASATDLREEIVAAEPESVDDFRARARAWIRGNLPASTPSDQIGYLRPRFTDEEELAEVDAGPRSCSASSTTPAWPACASRASTAGSGSRRRTRWRSARSSSGYEYPFRLQAPTFSPCAAVLLEFGTARAEAPPPPGDPQGRGVLDAAPVRAERRFRRGRRR